METCTVETGLLKKKPCGQPSVTHCLNCEQALCTKHAVAQVTATGKKTGKFMCKDCDAARREYEKTTPAAAPAAVPAAKAPAAEKGAAAPAAKAAAPAAAAKAPAPAAKTAAQAKEPPAAKPDDDAPLEFTPSEKKK